VRRAVLIAGALAFAPVPLCAQSLRYGGAHAGSLEAAAGVVWTAGYDAGSTQATETRNPSVGSSPLTLFNADARLRSAGGLQVVGDVYLNRRLAVEINGELSRPVFAVHLSGDVESAPDTTATEALRQYLVGGSVLYHFEGTDRFVPFVGVGSSYLRQVHPGSSAVDKGSEIHASGGIKYWFNEEPRAFGVRFELRGSSREGSVALTHHRRLVPEVRGTIAYRF
jgi:hypothetical protein